MAATTTFADPHRLSVAPMMGYTDRHCRYFLRQICRSCLLYTEMVTTGAILYGRDRDRFLRFHPDEWPVAIQLGGDAPTQLAVAARIAADWGYGEINLNVGCPSERVREGRFGACLMAEPGLVAEMVAAMGMAGLPVTVKHRIGIDHMEDYDGLAHFVEKVAEGGCRRFIVHARKAWLQGLSPSQNRQVPPLRYEWVYRLKADFPHLAIEINGGIRSLEEVEEHLRHVDGAMIGRAAYGNPWLLARADADIFGLPSRFLTRRMVAERMVAYLEGVAREGVRTHSVTRHMLGLFQGVPGARAWRRLLSQEGPHFGTGAALLERAMAAMSAELLDAAATSP